MADTTSWKDRAERLAATVRRYRDTASMAAAQFETDALTVGAGVLAGGMRGYFVGKGKTYAIGKTAKLSPELVAALPLKAFAYAGGRGPGVQVMHAGANGLLSFIGGFRAMEHMQKREQDAAKNDNGAKVAGGGGTRLDFLRQELDRRAAA